MIVELKKKQNVNLTENTFKYPFNQTPSIFKATCVLYCLLSLVFKYVKVEDKTVHEAIEASYNYTWTYALIEN